MTVEKQAPMSQKRLAEIREIAHGPRGYQHLVVLGNCDSECGACAIDELLAEVERYRGVDALAKELLARNIAFGTHADRAEAKCEDLEDELAKVRAQLAEAEQQVREQVATEPEERARLEADRDVDGMLRKEAATWAAAARVARGGYDDE